MQCSCGSVLIGDKLSGFEVKLIDAKKNDWHKYKKANACALYALFYSI